MAAALTYRDFRVLWTGAFVSSIGTWIQDVALSWVIHSEFKNPAYLGWRQFANELPLVAFMLLAGEASAATRQTVSRGGAVTEVAALVIGSPEFQRK